MDRQEWFDTEFDLAIKDLRPQATTGLGPLAYYGADVGTALLWDPIRACYDASRVEVLRGWTRMRFIAPREADPILVFVKPEPHSKQKIKEGRLRLIAAVGLIDTMVDRICFGWLARKVLATVGKTPALIGWSPYSGGHRFISFRYGGEPAMCLDRSSWDWTVQGWLLDVLKDVIKLLAMQAPPWWREWLDTRWEVLFKDALFGFRDGTRVRQPGWGVMKSGCYLTLVLNSMSQVVIHLIACRRLGIDPEMKHFLCMGDDTIQKVVLRMLEYIECLEQLGAVVKPPYVSTKYEFCGHLVDGLKLTPAYRSKHIFKILSAGPEELGLLLSAYQWCYLHDREMWDWLTTNIGRLAPHLRRTLQQAHVLIHEG